MDAITKPLFGALATAMLFWAHTPALAQDAFPNKPIRIVVPFSAGTAVDILPRLIAEKLALRWTQPVVVENRPGASGNIGAEAVARAEPNGYTLLASPPPPLVINQNFYTSLAFDPAAFVPVTVIAEVPNVLVVAPKTGLGSVEELITFATANPDQLSYASPGNATTPHLTAEWFKLLTRIRVVHVPYKGGAPALTDLLGGHVDMMFANLGDVLPYIRSGKLKALGVGSERRYPALPGVPALSERFPGFVSVAWYAIVAPPKTPSEIVAKLSAAIDETLKLPDIMARLGELAATPVGGTPAQTAAFMKEEAQRWRKVIVATGVHAD